jgi:hypothetical protein
LPPSISFETTVFDFGLAMQTLIPQRGGFFNVLFCNASSLSGEKLRAGAFASPPPTF